MFSTVINIYHYSDTMLNSLAKNALKTYEKRFCLVIKIAMLTNQDRRLHDNNTADNRTDDNST